MGNSSSQPKTETQKPEGFSFALRILNSIEKWLASIFELTEAEQKSAGVYFKDKDDT